MKLLFVGGTSFVGRHAVEVAAAAGHEVTVFHRGRTNADLLAGTITHLIGDRTTGDYSALEGGESWDAVIDVSAYVPRQVHQLADVVAARTEHYVHISSVSAYDEATVTLGEDSPLYADLADPTAEDITDGSYGPLKAMCERAALQRFADGRVAVIRPTYVVGPHDVTDRFTYWARRMGRGGDVAVIGPGEPLQVIDARDLGAFVVRCAETSATGPFDAVGPWAPLDEFLATITPAGIEVRLVDVGAPAVEAAEFDLPMLSTEPFAAELMSRPGARSVAAGLTTRALADTAEATRGWDRGRGEPPLKVGPSPEAEADLIAAGTTGSSS